MVLAPSPVAQHEFCTYDTFLAYDRIAAHREIGCFGGLD